MFYRSQPHYPPPITAFAASSYENRTIWKADNRELPGWEHTVKDNYHVYTISVEPSDKDRVLELCDLISDSSNPSNVSALWEMPYKVEVKKAKDNEWLTIKADYRTLIPAGYGDIRVWTSGLSYVSLGAEPSSEETIETELKVIDGTLNADGKTIKFANPSSPSIEFEILPTETDKLKKLTRGIAAFSIRGAGNISSYQKEIKVSALVDGKYVEPNFEYKLHAGLWDNTNIVTLLPPGTEKLVIKMTWDALPANTDGAPESISVENQVCQKAIEAIKSDFETNPLLWYDTDGDGIKEYIKSGLRKAVGENRNTTLVLNPDFKTADGFFPYGNTEVGTYRIFNGLTLSKVNGLQSQPAQEIDDNDIKFSGMIDSENSGSTDFYSGYHGNHFIYKMNAEGKYVKMPLKIMTLEEYYKLPAKDNYVNPLDMSHMFVRNTIVSEKFSDMSAVDLNGDGYLDFINASSGKYLLNTGMGSYVSEDFGGKVIFRDFDGDGLQDLLVYDSNTQVVSVIFQRPGGESVTKELMKGLACSENIWCRDFDGDGDVDILIPFDSDKNKGQAYLVMLENRGDRTFKRYENYVEGTHEFMSCIDINADGAYEVLSRFKDSDGGSKYTVKCLHLNGFKVISESETLFDLTSYNSAFLPLDMDDSGIMRIITENGIITPSPETVNTRPERPASPNVAYDADNERLTVTWNKGKDKETASADLTYELRIGTTPGSGDIVWADVNADGSRRNLKPGNSGYNMIRRFNTSAWPEGKIYVSLQVVDDCLRGSEFSEAAVFEKSAPSGFMISTSNDLCAVDETINLYTGFTPVDGTTYRWEAEGGEVRQIATTEYEAVFHSAGVKTITLVSTSADGKSSSTSKQIEIVPARFAETDINVQAALDMDLDGQQEVYAGMFYEGNDKGVYTDIKRLYNTNIECPDAITDVNKDGLPDFIVGTNFYINAEDKSYDTEEKPLSLAKYTIWDLDNDGYPEISHDYEESIYRNYGDFINYGKLSDLPLSKAFYRDFNGDGLLDYVKTDSDDLSFVIYENLGGMKFAESRRIKLPNGINSIPKEYVIGDFDGDNRPDFSFTMASSFGGVTETVKELYIVWNDGTSTTVPAPVGHEFNMIDEIGDFDNNGCDDIVIGEFCIYPNPDHSYSINKHGGKGYSLKPMYLRTDGLVGTGDRMLLCQKNTAPEAPSALKYSVKDKMLVIEWEAGSDKESPASSLYYNISIKKKGVSGDNAYIISPLNGTTDFVSVPTNAQLVHGTRYKLPLINLPEGAIEVRVQSVDRQGLTSAFSDILEISEVTPELLQMPEETMVNQPIDVILGNGIVAGDVDFGTDADVSGTMGNTVSVFWKQSGLHKITVKGREYEIMVHEEINPAFSFPEVIKLKDHIRVSCNNTSYNSKWEIGCNHYWGDVWHSFDDFDGYSIKTVDENTVDIYISKFAHQGCGATEIKIRRTVTESYGEASYTASFQFGSHGNYEISYVDIDETTGKHRVNWNISSHDSDVNGVYIFRESSDSDEYDLVGSASLGESSYIIEDSNPDVYAPRYGVALGYWYGWSDIIYHQPIHLNINLGLNDAVNLIWNKYVGRPTTTHRILRGADKNNLHLIDEVPGSVTSYTDLNADPTEKYYAIEVLFNNPSAAPTRAGEGKTASTRSNIVSTDQSGIDKVFVDEFVEVYNLNGIKVFEGMYNSNDRLPLDPGIYLIKHNNGRTTKIAVK